MIILRTDSTWSTAPPKGSSQATWLVCHRSLARASCSGRSHSILCHAVSKSANRKPVTPSVTCTDSRPCSRTLPRARVCLAVYSRGKANRPSMSGPLVGVIQTARLLRPSVPSAWARSHLPSQRAPIAVHDLLPASYVVHSRSWSYLEACICLVRGRGRLPATSRGSCYLARVLVEATSPQTLARRLPAPFSPWPMSGLANCGGLAPALKPLCPYTTTEAALTVGPNHMTSRTEMVTVSRLLPACSIFAIGEDASSASGISWRK